MHLGSTACWGDRWMLTESLRGYMCSGPDVTSGQDTSAEEPSVPPGGTITCLFDCWLLRRSRRCYHVHCHLPCLWAHVWLRCSEQRRRASVPGTSRGVRCINMGNLLVSHGTGRSLQGLLHAMRSGDARMRALRQIKRSSDEAHALAQARWRSSAPCWGSALATRWRPTTGPSATCTPATCPARCRAWRAPCRCEPPCA